MNQDQLDRAQEHYDAQVPEIDEPNDEEFSDDDYLWEIDYEVDYE